MPDFFELEDLWKFKTQKVEKREFSEEELKIIEKVEYGKKKNKMNFLIHDSLAIKGEDLEKVKQIKEGIEVIRISPPENWREEQKQLRLKGEKNYRKQISTKQSCLRRGDDKIIK